MKIQCDVCNKDQASVFCTADEAALCDGCDHRVHHANKLASKHQRFSLLNPSSKQFPLCDICQEKRALLFCQQDRAILCSDCDIPIHSANELTKKHNRYLLTGVKLSDVSCLYKPSDSKTNSCDLTVPDPKSSVVDKTTVVSALTTATKTTTTTETVVNNKDMFVNGNNEISSSTSSISEYLQMLPGWHVEDLLDFSSASFGFTQGGDDGKFPFGDYEFEKSNNKISSSSWSTDDMGIYVPQATTNPVYHHNNNNNNLFFGSQIGFGGVQTADYYVYKEAANSMKLGNQRRWSDDAFTVPEISPSSTHIGSKRARTLW
ncbi:B-box zinc finger protein 21-like [Rutidosis leptorrhynchoides]|uniref:B-box zinc finger protein 21-like n=1 Tax=Rutidosis leptorrhynchoides TaxID=125765 RepID=UPI003A99673E